MSVRNFYIPMEVSPENLGFQYASDFHIENHLFPPDEILRNVLSPSAPNLILCGDIGSASKPNQLERFLALCKSNWDEVIYIPGNHEYYGSSIESGDRIIREICRKLSIHYLNPGWVKIDNVIIVGCTLWSFIPQNETRLLKHKLNDFSRIDRHSTSSHNELFKHHSKYLQDTLGELCNDTANRFIIATHHCPDRDLSKLRGPATYDLSAGFGTDITERFSQYSHKIIAWIYGHTHQNERDTVNDINIICNQYGYSDTGSNGYDKSMKLSLFPRR